MFHDHCNLKKNKKSNKSISPNALHNSPQKMTKRNRLQWREFETLRDFAEYEQEYNEKKSRLSFSSYVGEREDLEAAQAFREKQYAKVKPIQIFDCQDKYLLRILNTTISNCDWLIPTTESTLWEKIRDLVAECKLQNRKDEIRNTTMPPNIVLCEVELLGLLRNEEIFGISKTFWNPQSAAMDSALYNATQLELAKDIQLLFNRQSKFHGFFIKSPTRSKILISHQDFIFYLGALFADGYSIWEYNERMEGTELIIRHKGNLIANVASGQTTLLKNVEDNFWT